MWMRIIQNDKSSLTLFVYQKLEEMNSDSVNHFLYKIFSS